MLLLLSFGALFIPILSQVLFFKIGKIRNSVTYFLIISFCNIVLQFITTIVSFILAVKAITQTGSKCATGAVGMLFFGFIFGSALILTIIIQFISRKKEHDTRIQSSRN